MRKTLLELASCALLGCGPFTSLPAADQDLWQRCANSIRIAQCPVSYDQWGALVSDAVCLRRVVDGYSEIPYPEARRAYLRGMGCPDGIVGYEAGDSAPVASRLDYSHPYMGASVGMSREERPAGTRFTLTLRLAGGVALLALSGVPGVDSYATMRATWRTTTIPSISTCSRVWLLGMPEPEDSRVTDTAGTERSVSMAYSPAEMVGALRRREGVVLRMCDYQLPLNAEQARAATEFLGRWH